MSELCGDSVGFEESASAGLLIRGFDVVIRLKMLLADEKLAEDVERSVYIHVQSKQPLPESVRVSQREPMKREVRAFCVPAVIDATSVNHFFY